VRSLFERTLDALPDGVLLTDSERRVVYADRSFAQLWKIPDELVSTKNELGMLTFVTDQLLDPEGFLREVDRLQLAQETSEDEILLKDGRIFRGAVCRSMKVEGWLRRSGFLRISPKHAAPVSTR
jgi:PAS domain-containing protein